MQTGLQTAPGCSRQLLQEGLLLCEILLDLLEQGLSETLEKEPGTIGSVYKEVLLQRARSGSDLALIGEPRHFLKGKRSNLEGKDPYQSYQPLSRPYQSLKVRTSTN